MLKIDNTLLQDIGLGTLPEGEKNSLLKHIYETLEMRVGIRLADQMSNQQLDEFEQYFEAKDDAGAFKWLESNFPNYKDIVQEEFDKLKAEVAQSAPQILASAQAAPAAQVPAGPVDTAQAAPFNPQAAQAPTAPIQAPQAQIAAAPVAPQYAPDTAQQPQAYAPAPQQSAQQPQYQAPAPQPYAPAPTPMPQADYPQQQPPAGPAQQ